MDELTIEQQRKAINYSVCFLRDEVESLRRAMDENVIGGNIRHQAQRRLAELKKDLEIFEDLHQKWDA